MLKQIHTVPDNVVALTATGMSTGDDYESIFIPLIKEKLKIYKNIRLLYHCPPGYKGFNSETAWGSNKAHSKLFKYFEKIAIVTDDKGMRIAFKVFGFTLPGEVMVFRNNHMTKAKRWIAQ